MKDSRANSIIGRTIVSLTVQAALSACAKKINPQISYREAVKAEGPETKLVYPWSSDIPSGSIAIHPLYGNVAWDSWWRFSTKEFISDLKSADDNPSIIGHIITVDSGGGECFGCHEAFEAVKALKKPCIALIDSECCSAAYWISCAADKIFASSTFSTIGSIGVMGVFYNYDKYFENEGINIHEYYSSYSDLKNKTFRDAENGDPEAYIKEFLDPFAEQFLADVKSVRNIPDDSEVLRGKAYLSHLAPQGELIDDLEVSIEEAVAEILIKAQSTEIDINTIKL